jgi:CheY-like chemotaxis protein
MIIQCPDCKARYRIKDIEPGRPDARFSCPNCKSQLILVAPLAEGQEPTVYSRPHVLIVDDAHFFREMLCDLLMPLNLNLSLAVDAADALKQLNLKIYDLILLDLNLPDRNGLDLIADIRKIKNLANIRILAMSGVFRREEDGMDAIRAGADGFLSKSFRPDDLREKVKKLLI